ncbi:MAG: hypothetical protein KBD16_00655 [Candidatus Pacebacteria bacterium]|nr:hypothetical protein [Candidatus Paceibacterota bacterium]
MSKASIEKLERHLKWEAAKEKKIAQDIMTKMVLAEIRPMVEAQIQNAKDGDTKAFDTLLDRTVGTAKSTLEVTGEVKFSLSSLAQQWEEQQKLSAEQRKLAPSEQNQLAQGISALLTENPATALLDPEYDE